MKTQLAIFRGDDFDYAIHAERVTVVDDPYAELIGQMASDSTARTYWLKCECGMLAITSKELHGQRTVCGNCQRNLDAPAALVGGTPVRAMTRRSEGRMLGLLIAFCVLVAVVFGSRFADAPSRDELSTVSLG